MGRLFVDISHNVMDSSLILVWVCMASRGECDVNEAKLSPCMLCIVGGG